MRFQSIYINLSRICSAFLCGRWKCSQEKEGERGGEGEKLSLSLDFLFPPQVLFHAPYLFPLQQMFSLFLQGMLFVFAWNPIFLSPPLFSSPTNLNLKKSYLMVIMLIKKSPFKVWKGLDNNRISSIQRCCWKCSEYTRPVYRFPSLLNATIKQMIYCASWVTLSLSIKRHNISYSGAVSKAPESVSVEICSIEFRRHWCIGKNWCFRILGFIVG